VSLVCWTACASPVKCLEESLLALENCSRHLEVVMECPTLDAGIAGYSFCTAVVRLLFAIFPCGREDQR